MPSRRFGDRNVESLLRARRPSARCRSEQSRELIAPLMGKMVAEWSSCRMAYDLW